MKWLATILALYFSVLYLVPCSDADNSCKDAQSLSQEMAHDHSQDTDDHCTPFCQCACCGISITTCSIALPEFKVPTRVFTIPENTTRDCQFISNYYGSIWQPPKLNA